MATKHNFARCVLFSLFGHVVDIDSVCADLALWLRDNYLRSYSMPHLPITSLPTRRVLTHLDRLEAESIHILREVVTEAERPVMLYSIGKDLSHIHI